MPCHGLDFLKTRTGIDQTLPSKNYHKGRTFEYRVQNYLRKKGYYVIRSYGSKGLYDLIAIPPPNEKGMQYYPLMIQCKTNGYIKPIERESLKINKYKWQGRQIIAVNESHKLVFKSLDGIQIII